MANLNFKRLTITDWKQFDHIDIEFHQQLTVLTGANGSGKTTILNLLARHFGWNHQELAIPSIEENTGLFRFFSRFFKSPISKKDQRIGSLIYSNDKAGELSIPENNSAQYTISILGQQPIRGLSIPSHRSIYFYRQVPHISTTKRSRTEAFNLAYGSAQSSYFNNGGQTSSFYLKETLMSWAINGEGNRFVVPDQELKRNFIEFQDTLKKVLPRTIGFNEILIRNYEIVLLTNSGDFMLDAVSGGVSAIIDLAWQIFTYSNNSKEFITVLIDEIENHLHPQMQRLILPSLIDAFPNIQFIISTHSPLIVGSVKDSNVYAFRYKNQDGGPFSRVYNEKLDLINKAKTATEILNEVLGVPFTMPLWVEDELTNLILKYSSQNITENTFDKMRSELEEMGLEEMMPEVMKKTLNSNDQTNKRQ